MSVITQNTKIPVGGMSYVIDATLGNITIYLPNYADYYQFSGNNIALVNTYTILYTFKRTDNSGHTVTITTPSPNTNIDGVSTLTITSKESFGLAFINNSYSIISDYSTSSGGGGKTTFPLTIGTGLSGTSFNGAAPITIAIDSSVVTLTGAQALSNKTGLISQWTNDSGYITSTGITPAALTKVDDTNVTLTLGGTPATALLQATSLTLGWTGTLADGRIASATTWNNKVTSLTGGTGISIGGTTTVPIITNSAPDQTVAFTNGTGISVTGTYPNFTVTNTAPSTTSGTVTSVAATVPTGLSISGSPITSSGTLAISLTAGYSIPTTASQTNWDTAYTNRITSLTTTGTSGAATLIANTLNIPQYTSSSGTVTSVSVTTANGISGTVATATTTPAITLTLGAITPSSVNGTTSTEIGYVSGVTSAIQTQINSKQATITTGITAQYLRGDLSLATTPTTSYSILQGVIGAVVGASVTRYNSFDAQTMSTTELPRQVAIPFACTLDKFYVTTTTAQPASGTLVVTIRKNSADTALTVTIPISTGAGTNVADTTHSVSFAAGDLLSISFVNNATGNSCTMSVSCRVAMTIV